MRIIIEDNRKPYKKPVQKKVDPDKGTVFEKKISESEMLRRLFR